MIFALTLAETLGGTAFQTSIRVHPPRTVLGVRPRNGGNRRVTIRRKFASKKGVEAFGFLLVALAQFFLERAILIVPLDQCISWIMRP
jgi:hypothetical protein